MGQRLVITIHAFDEDIATIYYHWSAYTTSAIYEAERLISDAEWKAAKTKDELILALTKQLELQGGGVSFNDLNVFRKMYLNREFKEDTDRNEGLIAISADGIKNQQYWSEGDMTIDFDTETIYNSVCCTYQDEEELKEERIADVGEYDLNPSDFPILSFDPTEFSFWQLSKVTKDLNGGSKFYWFPDGIFEKIE